MRHDPPDLATRRDLTLVEALVEAAGTDAPFATFHGSGPPRRLDARAALATTLRWASALRALGVRPHEAVAIVLPTSEDFVGAFFGAAWIGAVPLPLATPMTFGGVERYLEHARTVLAHAGVRVLVGTPRVVEAAAGTSLATMLSASLTPAEVPAAPRHVSPSPVVQPSHPALLQYTSGTTGRPKGVVISHRAAIANARAIAHALRLSPHDVGVSWLPLYHDMGLVGAMLTAIVQPYALHLLPTEGFVMRPRRWLELMSDLGGTISVAPNFAYEMVARRADAAGLDLSQWRAALDGAEPVHGRTLRRFGERFASAGFRASSFCPVYGLAEATLAVTAVTPGAGARSVRVDRELLAHGRACRSDGDDARELVSLGVPVLGTSIEIVDHDGRALPEGHVGEIAVRSRSLMSGYHRDDEETARALGDGRLRTGDLGFVVDGELYVSGRARALIIQGGRNVHPEDVERIVVDADERVHAAAALAIPSEASGTEELVVVVEARGLDGGSKLALEALVRGELLALAGVRADRVVVRPIGAIPRTSSGKLRRGECARLLAEEESGCDAPS